MQSPDDLISQERVLLSNGVLQMEPLSAERDDFDKKDFGEMFRTRTQLEQMRPQVSGHDSEEEIKEPTVGRYQTNLVSRIRSEMLAQSSKSILNNQMAFTLLEERDVRRLKQSNYRTKYQWQGQQLLQPMDLGLQSSFKHIEVDDAAQSQTNNIPLQLSYEVNTPQSMDGMHNVWKLRALVIVHHISKFIQALKTKTDKIKFRLMTMKMFQIIGDSSSDYEAVITMRHEMRKPTLGDWFRGYCICLEHLLWWGAKTAQDFIDKHINVLQPDSAFKMIWDSLVVLLIVLNIFYIPMKLSFVIDKKDNQATVLLLETFPSYVFIVEIILNFNTAYYHKGIIYTNRRQIFKHYISSQFWWDLIVVIPFIISQFNVPFTEFTPLLRVTRIRSMVAQLEEALNMREKYQAVFDVLKLAYFVIFVAHFCACAWHYLAIIEVQLWDAENSWLQVAEIADAHWLQKYIRSIYWSTITILTVGYGDITPVTDYERVFVIFVALIICGAFGYSISAIGTILQRLEEKKAVYRLKLKIINHHIQKRGLNKQLQLKVRKYFEYYFKLEEEENSEAEQLMSQLTKRLKEEVLIDIYKKVLKGSRLLGQNFSMQLLNSLCLRLRERKYAPEEEIFVKGEIAHKLIFVLSGEIQIYAEGEGGGDEPVETNFRTYKTGFVIGEKEFLTNRMYEYNARALKFTQVAILDYDEFYRILQDFRSDFERFCLIRDNLLFNENFKSMGKVCEICQSSHSFLRCPFVFYQANQAKILTTFRSSKQQKRQWLQRQKQKTNIRSCLNDIQEAALGLILGNKLLPEDELTDQYLGSLGFKLADDNDYDDDNTPTQKSRNNQSVMANNSTQRILAKTESQNLDFDLVNPMERSEHKTFVDTAFFAKEQESEQDDIDWDQGSKIAAKRGVLIAKKGLKGSQIDHSVIMEDMNDDGAQIEQSIRKVQFKVPNHRIISITGMQSTHATREEDRHLSGQAKLFRNYINTHQNKTASKQLSRSFSKISMDSSMHDRHDHKNHSNVSLQAIDLSKRFDSDRRKVKRKRSIIGGVTSILENHFTPQHSAQHNPPYVGPHSHNRRSSLTSNKGVFKRADDQRDSYLNEKLKLDQTKIDSHRDGQHKEKTENSPLLQIDDNPNIPMEIKVILHEHTDLDLDRAYLFTVYFPYFNLDQVLQKVNSQLAIRVNEKNNGKRQMLMRTRTSVNPFDRIHSFKPK